MSEGEMLFVGGVGVSIAGAMIKMWNDQNILRREFDNHKGEYGREVTELKEELANHKSDHKNVTQKIFDKLDTVIDGVNDIKVSHAEQKQNITNLSEKISLFGNKLRQYEDDLRKLQEKLNAKP